jgi:hypothetical protein
MSQNIHQQRVRTSSISDVTIFYGIVLYPRGRVLPSRQSFVLLRTKFLIF